MAASSGVILHSTHLNSCKKYPTSRAYPGCCFWRPFWEMITHNPFPEEKKKTAQALQKTGRIITSKQVRNSVARSLSHKRPWANLCAVHLLVTSSFSFLLPPREPVVTDSKLRWTIWTASFAKTSFLIESLTNGTLYPSTSSISISWDFFEQLWEMN